MSSDVLSGYLKGVFEPRFTGQGHWANAPIHRVLMSLIRKRPRDLIKLCTSAARVAAGEHSELIRTNDLKAVFEEYSQGRIQDTINEYRTELPDIGRLLFAMKPSKKERTAREAYTFSTASLLKKIESAIQTGAFHFKSGCLATRHDLAQFLYKINFLTARKELETGLIHRKYFEENRYLSDKWVDFGFDWEIHPAYRWALQPDDILSLFDSIQLSDS